MKRLTALALFGLTLVSGCIVESSQSDESAGGVPGRAGSAGELAVGGSAGSGAVSSAGELSAGGSAGGVVMAGSAGQPTAGGSAGVPAGGNAGAVQAGSGGAEIGGAAGAVSFPGSAGAAGSEPKSQLDSANEELAAGATEVTLDDDTVLKVTRRDGKLVSWEVTVSGNPAMVVVYGDEDTQVAIDENMDGYIEYLRILTGTSEDDLVTVQETSKEGASPTRQTITRNGSVDDLHIVDEVQASDSAWEISDEGDATKQAAYDAATTVDGGSGACTPAQMKMLQDAARAALDKGVQCLKSRGLSGLAASLQALAAANGFNIVCKAMKELAYADVPGWESNELDNGSHRGQAQIEFNPNCVAAPGSPAPCASKASADGLLFHEMLHFLQGAHSLWFLLGGDQELAEQDVIYSCQFACFDTSLLTKCSCATCSANYTPCSPECKSKAKCHDEEKGYCHFHCPCNNTDYDTVGECNGGCDVSLACFSGICAPAP